MDSWATTRPKPVRIEDPLDCNRKDKHHAIRKAEPTISGLSEPAPIQNIEVPNIHVPSIPKRSSFTKTPAEDMSVTSEITVPATVLNSSSIKRSSLDVASPTKLPKPAKAGFGERTASTADRLRRQGFRASDTSKGGQFAVKYTKRGSDDWRNVIKPFVSDLAFRCCVTTRFQGEIRFRPYHCQAAVLFVDLSGYSKITAAIAHRGAHALSSVVNAYLSKILRVVQQYGGDVIKFAGDAVMIVWEGTQTDLPMNVMVAAKCAMDIQNRAASYPVDGTDLIFRCHCGLACGPLESEIFEAHEHTNMQKLYHAVGGESLYEISELVDLAAAGEVCASANCIEYLGFDQRCTLREIPEKPVECAGAMVLEQLRLSTNDITNMDERIENLLAERMLCRNVSVEEDFIHPTILKLLMHGGQSPTQIAQMRNLCVLFIAMTGAGSAVNWLMEVQGVLDQQRCPIVQIIDDDKGVHVIAAVNLYESIPEASVFGLTACRRLIDRQVGCAIGVAMGPTFCGVTGSKQIACRWDITGPPAVRAARLMQYAIKNQVPIAIDESLYAIPVAAGRLEVLDPEVRLKGTKKPIAVYKLSEAEIQCAYRLLETVHARVHDEKMMEIAEIVKEAPRSALIVTGVALSGKKILCQRVAGECGFVPILHTADPTNGLLQLADTLASWFRYCDVGEVTEMSMKVFDSLEKKHWTWAHDLCVKMVNVAIDYGLDVCVVVDRVQFLDEFSVSLIRECLNGKRQRHRHGSHQHIADRMNSGTTRSTRSSSHSGSSVSTLSPESGRVSFLCVHTQLFHWNTAKEMATDIRRSHRFIDVPIFEIGEVDREDLRRMFRDLSDMEVEDRWLYAYSESSGYCAGYFVERAAASRNISGQMWAQGKAGLAETSENLVLSIPPGLVRRNRAFPVTEVNADLAMRFFQMYDELPPLFQMVAKVIAVGTGKGYFSVPRFVVWEVLNDLIAEGVESATLEIVLKEMVDLHLCKQSYENEEQVFCMRSPGMADVCISVCTPVQLSAIRVALLERLEPIQMRDFKVPLVMADMHAELKQKDKEESMKGLWQLGYAQMINLELPCSRHWIELVQDEIRHYGYSPMEIVGEEMDLSPIKSAGRALPLIKIYMWPVAFGPMGTTMTVVTRNLFHEWGNFHGASKEDIEKRQKDTDSATGRYLKQVDIVEELLDSRGIAMDAELRAKEKEWTERLRTPAINDADVEKKARLFLDKFIPEVIEDRLTRLHKLVVTIQSEPLLECMETADLGLLKAYQILSGKTCKQLKCRADAAQHSLMVMASKGWKPRPLPEFLPILHQQTVARLRNKCLKRLSASEKVIFRHQQSVDDLEAFLIVTALLHKVQDEGRV